jgi:hypothetical protein
LKTLKDVRTNSKEYRRLHLERFAAAIDAAAGKEPDTKTNTIIQLMRFKEDRIIHLKCQNDMGKRRGPGISELMVPSDPNEEPSNNTTEWTIEGDKKNVANAIMKQNDEFLQSIQHTLRVRRPQRGAGGGRHPSRRRHDVRHLGYHRTHLRAQRIR